MNEISATILLVFLFALRCLLPLVITLAIGYLMNRLVEHWQAEERAADLLGRLGLGERLHHKPSKLSGGEQQRVAVARALANRPLLVLADEPTGNLDEATADRVFDQFVGLVRDHGSAALVATHNERLAAKMDRVLRLHEGHIEA